MFIKGKGFVYRWTNRKNGKWYIGSHCGQTDDGYVGSGLIFKSALQKYGLEYFDREILYEGPDFREFETKILIELDAAGDPKSYNMKNEALGGSFPGDKNGMHQKGHTEEAKEKISCAVKERWKSLDKRLALSKRMSGQNNPMYGVTRSDFTKQKISQTKQMKIADWKFLKTEKHHRSIFQKIYRNIVKNGKYVSPRGLKVLELENYSYVLPPFVRFQNFQCRKLSINYIKSELLWYLRGDKTDLSILDKAKIWKEIVNDDGTLNSNYGQYIFGQTNQFDNVVSILSADKDSRRASIMLLNEGHLFSDTKDVPCTYSMNFRVRENRLNMSVHMRSQDAIYGMGNDAPAFSIIHEMMLNALREYYPELVYGDYFHIADSFHVYERHFGMLEKLAGKSLIDRKSKCRPDRYMQVLCPQISGPDEVKFMRQLEFSDIPKNFKFTRWLLER